MAVNASARGNDESVVGKGPPSDAWCYLCVHSLRDFASLRSYRFNR